ncbi:hypothetical protein [Stanieria cyanosphaera]|nr:hypothetical protein [Stanieria cyanosphaera]
MRNLFTNYYFEHPEVSDRSLNFLDFALSELESFRVIPFNLID